MSILREWALQHTNIQINLHDQSHNHKHDLTFDKRKKMEYLTLRTTHYFFLFISTHVIYLFVAFICEILYLQTHKEPPPTKGILSAHYNMGIVIYGFLILESLFNYHHKIGIGAAIGD